MKSDDEIKGIFSDEVMRDYLSASETSIRYAVTRIAAECDTIFSVGSGESNDLTKHSAKSILTMCCRLMQASEVYSFLAGLTDVTKTETGTIEVSSYLDELASRCRSTLGSEEKVVSDCRDKHFIRTSERLLSFVLLSFIRAKIASGAGKIKLRYGGKRPGVSVTAYGIGKAPDVQSDDFICRRIPDIVKSFAEKYAEGYRLTDSKLVIYFNSVQIDDSCELRSPIQTYESDVYSVFNIILSDLDENNFV